MKPMPHKKQRTVSLLVSIAGTFSAGALCFYIFHASETVAALLFMLWTMVVG